MEHKNISSGWPDSLQAQPIAFVSKEGNSFFFREDIWRFAKDMIVLTHAGRF